MTGYLVEFILHLLTDSRSSLKGALSEFGTVLEICDAEQPGQGGRDIKVRMDTQDPAAIFDIAAQFGRIRSVKVEEGRRRE
jgi:dihydroxyacetone kinase-like predicted kinase